MTGMIWEPLTLFCSENENATYIGKGSIDNSLVKIESISINDMSMTPKERINSNDYDQI